MTVSRTSLRQRCHTALGGLAALLVCAGAGAARAQAGVPPGCTFVTATSAAPAFCETFSRVFHSHTRSGQLDGVLWGVSRATSRNAPARGLLYDWASARRDTCGSSQVVGPEAEVAVCQGRAVEAIDDAGATALLAMYPRQPFDFAGRTGTVAFDVSDDTAGPHAAWPALLITDQPVPAPYSQQQGIDDNGHASVGFTLAGTCQQLSCGGLNAPSRFGVTQTSCVGVDTIFYTRNYRLHHVPFNRDGCVIPAPGPQQLNHFEVQVSSAGIRVYASDPGNRQSTRLIADASFDVPLTRGLVWLEDVHWQAGRFNNQQTHTFAWANLAFDGPRLPRDRGFDVLDARRLGPRASDGMPTVNLGYYVPPHRPLELVIPRVSALRRAKGALLELTCWADRPQTLEYSLNGHRRLRLRWPFGVAGADASQTLALPVPLSELQAGNNRLRLWTSDPSGIAVANFDLILQAAGGVPPPPT